MLEIGTIQVKVQDGKMAFLSLRSKNYKISSSVLLRYIATVILNKSDLAIICLAEPRPCATVRDPDKNQT